MDVIVAVIVNLLIESIVGVVEGRGILFVNHYWYMHSLLPGANMLEGRGYRLSVDRFCKFFLRVFFYAR